MPTTPTSNRPLRRLFLQGSLGLAASAMPGLRVTRAATTALTATGSLPSDSSLFSQWVAQPGISTELRQLRELISHYFQSVPAHASLAEKRTARANLYLQHIPLPNDLRFTPVELAGVRGEWSETPASDPHRILLYLHGGGYVVGSAKGWRAVGAVLGRAAGMRTFKDFLICIICKLTSCSV